MFLTLKIKRHGMGWEKATDGPQSRTLAQEAFNHQVYLGNMTSHILPSSNFLITGSLYAISISYKLLLSKHTSLRIPHIIYPQMVTCKPFMTSHPDPLPLPWDMTISVCSGVDLSSIIYPAINHLSS